MKLSENMFSDEIKKEIDLIRQNFLKISQSHQ